MTTLATKPPIHQSSEAAHPTRTTIRRSTSSTATSETSSTKTLTWSQSMKTTEAQSQWETPPGKCPLSIMAQSLHSITMANLNYSHLLARQWKLMVIKQVSPKKAWVHRRSLTASDFKMPIWPKRSMNVWGTSRVKSRPLSIPEYLTCTQARSTRIRNQGSTPWWSSSWSTWISSTRSARTACLSLAKKSCKPRPCPSMISTMDSPRLASWHWARRVSRRYWTRILRTRRVGRKWMNCWRSWGDIGCYNSSEYRGCDFEGESLEKGL